MTLTRAAIIDSIPLGPTDFVVEIGAGNRPFSRTDLILDKYPYDTSHCCQSLSQRVPVLIADGARLPLPDKGCDLLIAAHVLEHVPDPDAFLREIRRCSRRVYLEFPSLMHELMFAWGFHEWFITAEGSHLTFYREDIPQLFGDFFHRHYDFLLDAWFVQRNDELNSWVYCESDALTWEMASESAFERALRLSATGRDRVNAAPIAPVDYSWRQVGTLALQRLLPGAAMDRLVGAVRRKRHRADRPLTQALVDRLTCLHCDGGRLVLEAGGDEIRCRACDATYGRRHGFLDFDVGVRVPA